MIGQPAGCDCDNNTMGHEVTFKIIDSCIVPLGGRSPRGMWLCFRCAFLFGQLFTSFQQQHHSRTHVDFCIGILYPRQAFSPPSPARQAPVVFTSDKWESSEESGSCLHTCNLLDGLNEGKPYSNSSYIMMALQRSTSWPAAHTRERHQCDGQTTAMAAFHTHRNGC